MQFAKNSTLDDDGQNPPLFDLRTGEAVSLPSITMKWVKAITSCQLRRSLLVKAIMSWQLPSPVDLMAFQWLSSTIFLQNFLLSCPNFPWMCINRQVSFLLKFDSVVPFPKKASDLSQPSSYQSFPNRRQNLRTAHEHDINFLESQHLLSNMQYTCIYDFRHSLSSPTSYLAQHISRVLDRQDENRSVALDISKALDKSWHQSLHKLLSHGITGPLHQLLTSFLKGRQMSVVLDGQKSSTKHINTGVPQGSILRPTLSLFISTIFQMTLSASWWCTQTTPLSKTSCWTKVELSKTSAFVWSSE